jgi:hypothetical protein
MQRLAGPGTASPRFAPGDVLERVNDDGDTFRPVLTVEQRLPAYEG